MKGTIFQDIFLQICILVGARESRPFDLTERSGTVRPVCAPGVIGPGSEKVVTRHYFGL